MSGVTYVEVNLCKMPMQKLGRCSKVRLIMICCQGGVEVDYRVRSAAGPESITLLQRF